MKLTLRDWKFSSVFLILTIISVTLSYFLFLSDYLMFMITGYVLVSLSLLFGIITFVGLLDEDQSDD